MIIICALAVLFIMTSAQTFVAPPAWVWILTRVVLSSVAYTLGLPRFQASYILLYPNFRESILTVSAIAGLATFMEVVYGVLLVTFDRLQTTILRNLRGNRP
jgi:hypothetical protein